MLLDKKNTAIKKENWKINRETLGDLNSASQISFSMQSFKKKYRELGFDDVPHHFFVSGWWIIMSTW